MGTTVAPDVRQDLSVRLAQARAETDALFGIIHPDSLYERPIPERHRIIFYIGHLEAFDWNLLREPLGLAVFNADFDRLFAFGIDPVDGGLPADVPADWPSFELLQSYRGMIRKLLDGALAERMDDESMGQLLNIAIEHRLMHAETLEYMFHQLPFASKIRPLQMPALPATDITPQMVPIPAGRATLGLRRGSGVFGWDNEFDEHKVEVPAFSIGKYKVTNGEFLKFVEAGGYSRPELWSGADWQWRQEAAIKHPVFWVRTSENWHYRTMFEEIPLRADWPVLVSQAEASAYAAWAGMRLPSEAEWHRAAYGSIDRERAYPWGDEAPLEARIYWNPPPAGASPESESAFGVQDLIGTAWEWTSSLFAPFPGFEIMPVYPGYSANFFDGHHYVMKGGSSRTAAVMLRRSFRNWFQPHYQYVYAGFRCVFR